jgi:hypothetical protein
LDAVEVARWGYRLDRRDDADHHHGWSRTKSPRDQRNHSHVRNVRLAVSSANYGGRLKSALFPHSSHRRRIFVSVDAPVQVAYHQERNVSLINVTKVFFMRA